jgi:hypothetical protein
MEEDTYKTLRSYEAKIKALEAENKTLRAQEAATSYDFDRGWNRALEVMLKEQDVLRGHTLQVERQCDRLLAALQGCEQTLLEHIDCARNEATSSNAWERVKAAIQEHKNQRKQETK